MISNEKFERMELAENSLESAIRRRLRKADRTTAYSLSEVAWVAGDDTDKKKVQAVLDRLVESGLVECRVGNQPYYRWVW